MHGFPVMRTAKLFFSNPKESHPQSQAVDCRNKGHGAETRIARYLSENFRYDMKLENFVYCSQLLQSEAYGYALRDWKRKFRGPGQELCAGALIWQVCSVVSITILRSSTADGEKLNDIYPVTSWAFVDYFLRPKPAYYTIRRTCAAISVGVERKPPSLWYDEDHPKKRGLPAFEIFAHNITPVRVEARMEISGYDMHSQCAIPFPSVHSPLPVTLEAGRNTELYSMGHTSEADAQESTAEPGTQSDGALDEQSLIVLCVRLIDPSSGKTLARVVDWPEPFRYLHWAPDTSVAAKVIEAPEGSEWEKRVLLSANRPVKGCFVSGVGLPFEAAEPLWDDNMVDLMPDEEIVLNVNGLLSDKVAVRFLNDWELEVVSK